MAEQPDDWVKETLDSAIHEIISTRQFNEPVIRAKPVWHLPGALLLAQFEVADSAYWLITGGGGPTDILNAELANQPRDAARHFSLKWQLGAQQLLDGEVAPPADMTEQEVREKTVNLIRCAEALSELVSKEQFWLNS